MLSQVDPGDPERTRCGALGALRSTVASIDGGHALGLTGLRSDGQSDLAAVLHDRGDRDSTLIHAADALQQCPEVASVARAGRRILARLSDPFIAQLGEPLECGTGDRLAPEEGALAGRRFMIQYLDPNATKALHVGHLRNVALGNALRCGLRAVGADAFARTAIGDAGQQVGEAMAGCLRYGDPSMLEGPGVRGDLVVGSWYARYVAEHRSLAGDDEAVVAAADAVVAREVAVRDDLATSLLGRWQAGDAEVAELWRRIRDAAVAGQNRTLARLGVRFDVEISEADYARCIPPFVDEALRRGVIGYASNGALVYETGDADYPVFPLARPDGFPTQNLRTLVLWHELMPEIPHVTTINIVGEEWRAHTIYVRQILERMGRDLPIQPTHDVVHGMISAGDGDMSSSAGGVVLIDDLLDELAGAPALRALAIGGRDGCEAEDLAVLAALAFCLNRPLNKGMAVTAPQILDPTTGVGLMLARAWTKAWSPDADGDAGPDPRDPAYRFAVMYCQFQSDVLSQALVQRDVTPAIRSLVRMAKWYVARPGTSASVDRVMRAALARGLGALGLAPATPSVRAAAPASTRFGARRHADATAGAAQVA